MSACGGASHSSGARTVSGVAAAGAAIYGKVTAKDSNGSQAGPVFTDKNGNFTLDVTGLIPPFILKVDGKTGTEPYVLYSATSQTSSVNINPFTNLALAVASGIDPSQVFGPQSQKPGAIVNDSAMQTALLRTKEILQPLLDKYGVTTFKPLNGSYAADSSNRLDSFLDVVMVRAENGEVTITNKLNGHVIASKPLTSLADIALDISQSADQAVLSDIQELTARMVEFSTTISKVDALTSQDVEEFFVPDPRYGTSSGFTREQDIAGVIWFFGPGATYENGKLLSIRNIRLACDISADYSAERGVSKVYVLNYDFIHDTGKIVTGKNVTIGKEITTTKWKFIGDPYQTTSADGNYGGIFTYENVAITPNP